jgi:SAM-dependent methyltransferase
VNVHQGARAFSKVAVEYEQGRPDYPSSALDWIVQVTGIGEGEVVVDLGAGTGKFTRLLIGTGARIFAVEPIDEMRSQLRVALPGIEAVDATAEATGLPSRWATLVTAATAFHWFATAAALEEIARILRPGGHLVLAWNRRDDSDPLQAQLSEVLGEYEEGRDSPGSSSDVSWKEVLEASDLFEAVGEKHLSFVQVLDRDGLLARFESMSWIAALDGERRTQLLERIGAVAPGGPVRRGRASAVAERSKEYRLAYLTDCYAFRRRD